MEKSIGAPYRPMFRSLVRRLIMVSLLPLLVIGGANFYLFYNLNRSVVLEQHANVLRYHRESIQTVLQGWIDEISTLAQQYSLEEMKNGALDRIFKIVQQRGGFFSDMGIIDSEGNHLIYIGPYDLMGKNYRETEWFRQVVDQGVYVSDMFMGYRGVPHMVLAVKRMKEEGFWIFRATINTDYFSRIVDVSTMGKTGETFIINSRGLYQAKTRSSGDLLTPSGYPDLTPHEDIRVRELTTEGKRYLYTTTWLRYPRWLLLFRQESGDVYSPLWKASLVGIVLFLAGALGAAILSIAITKAQVLRIQKADREKENLTQKLLVASRTAAVGEMSAGLAHEINNPLAIIETLQTWIRDLAATPGISEEDRLEILESSSKIGEQVARCKTITQGLLKFARKVDSQAQKLDLNQMLQELAAVAQSRAKVENVRLQLETGEIPLFFAPHAHMQQIFMNLVNNALDAVAGKEDGVVRILSRLAGGKITVSVEDNGTGIPKEVLSRIFVPFFTTKPVGKGTGLGLAICYGLVHDMGGTILVESTPGVGTTFTVELPMKDSNPGEEKTVKAEKR